jgi:hypothetical protein
MEVDRWLCDHWVSTKRGGRANWHGCVCWSVVDMNRDGDRRAGLGRNMCQRGLRMRMRWKKCLRLGHVMETSIGRARGRLAVFVAGPASDHVALEGDGSVDLMKLVVKTAGIAQDFTRIVLPPERRQRGLAVIAHGLGAHGGRNRTIHRV